MLVCCLLTAYCMAQLTYRSDRLVWSRGSGQQRRPGL